jgi:TolB-like protein
MLTGKLPFRGEHEAAILYSIVHEEPKAISSLRADIPPNVESIIAKVLQKGPGDRFQDMEELLSHLSTAQKKDKTVSKKSLPSIAVLPFVNMSNDVENEYFSDGLAEELINALSKLGDLHVVARTSAFRFRGKDLDIREVGKQLNVSTVLEGSVRKAGNRLRITAQLISAADGYHLWSERFDRNIKDVFAVQDEIAMAVVEKLKVALLEGEKEKVTKRYTRDEKAYQLYLKGRYHWNKRYPRAMLKAVDYFQQAIDKDPRYALPYVGIADVFNMLAEFGFVPPQDAYLKSRTLLQRAQELDDSLSELYVSLALITYCFEWDLPAAERHVRRSIELNPQNWYAHGTRAEILAAQDRWEEAREEVNKAMELDPLSSMVHALFGIMLVGSGRIEEGREALSKTIAMEPDQPMFHYWMGMFSLTHPVLPGKAIVHLQKALDLGVSPACGYLGVAYALADRKEDALRCLQMLERIEEERFIPLLLKPIFYLKPGLRRFQSFKRKYVPPYLKAIIYCGLKMEEEAIDQFEKSGQARDYLLPAFFCLAERYPWMSELMISPRLQALRAKIKTA